MNRIKTILISSIALLALAITGTASAASFTETLTKNDFLNSGLVSESTPLEFTHTFLPGVSVATIDYVYLGVVVTDDFYCVEIGSCTYESWSETESTLLSLNDVDWKDGGATFNIFWGDVTAEANIQAVGDIMDVKIVSTGGDFLVHSSSMYVIFEPGEAVPVVSEPGVPSSSVPEPSAAMVFLIGGLTLSRGWRGSR